MKNEITNRKVDDFKSKVWTINDKKEFIKSHDYSRYWASNVRSFVSVLPLFTYTYRIASLRAQNNSEKTQEFWKEVKEQKTMLNKMDYKLLIPIDVFTGYSTGMQNFHTINNLINAKDRYEHLDEIIKLINNKNTKLQIRFYENNESVHFTIFEKIYSEPQKNNEYRLYMIFNPSKSTNVYGFTSQENDIIQPLVEHFDTVMWEQSIGKNPNEIKEIIESVKRLIIGVSNE